MEQIGPCTLYQGDCLQVMEKLASTVNHVITDPPYEDAMHNAKAGKRKIRTDGGKAIAALDFKSITDIRAEYTELAAWLCDGWFINFCTPEGVAAWRDAIEANKIKYKRACVWVKPDAAPQFNGQGPAMGAEMIVTAWAGKGVSKWNGGGRRGVFTHNCNPPTRDGRHPTEKPVALMMELIKLFTNPGDVILDPFMGSGTTLLAAAMCGRKAIGIEKDPKYYKVAVDRLSADMLVVNSLENGECVEKNDLNLFGS